MSWRRSKSNAQTIRTHRRLREQQLRAVDERIAVLVSASSRGGAR